MPYPDDSGGRCPIQDCKRGRGPGMLMCKPCWSKVPLDLQVEVYSAWRARRKAVDDTDYKAAALRHEEAKKAAIDAVERR